MITKFTGLARKLPAPLYKLAAQGWIDHEFPRHIFIETTSACNLSCEYCPREKRSDHMDWKLFRQIVDEAGCYGPRSFSLHLFGEPLMWPHILEGIRYIKRKRGNTVLLTTNGTLLNKFAAELDRLRVDRIIWTWRKNNFTPDTLRVLRKIGLIRLLVEETPPEDFEKWKDFPRVEIKHLHNYGGQIDTSKWGLHGDDGGARYPCYHLWLAPAVRWNGEITICCNDPNGKESLGSYSAGDSITSAWRGTALSGIRKGQMNGEYKGICANCNVWKTYPDLFFGFQKKCAH